MKFAKELDDNAVPEWREKYLDYKQAKKEVKAVGRAIRSVERNLPNRTTRPSPFASLRDAPVYSFLNRPINGGATQNPARTRSEAPGGRRPREEDVERWAGRATLPRTINERSPLRQNPMEERVNADNGSNSRMARYGSIIGSPPSGTSPMMENLTQHRTQASLLELPDPALDPDRSKDGQNRTAAQADPDYDRPISPGSPNVPARPPPSQLTHTGNAYEGGSQTGPHSAGLSRVASLRQAGRANSTPDLKNLNLMKRLAFIKGPSRARTFNQGNDVALEAYREVDFRQAQFFLFLDNNLVKIEEFYREKEDEATKRLDTLREQLHILRNQRALEVEAAEQRRRHQTQLRAHSQVDGSRTEAADVARDHGGASSQHDLSTEQTVEQQGQGMTRRFKNSMVSQMDNALDKVRTGHIGKTSKAMRDLGTPSFRLEPDAVANPETRDYVRKSTTGVSYRRAKRKLKYALVEYYRGLELLKSYALLNRTAFRKINKKYDKTVNARPPMRYMAEKVDKAHFTNSDTVEKHIQAVEDLYARYFERGNHKIAVGKLRAKGLRVGQYTGSMFRAGFFAAAGLVLAVLALVRGLQTDLHNSDLVVRTHASYLLQIYAGYLFLLGLAAFFCIDARAFAEAKINYVFVFELDPRDHLDWRQLSEFPAFFTFLFGLVMYLNFQWVGGALMYTYWPVVLIGLSFVVLFLPAPIFYWKGRQWFLYSMMRLFFAGVFDVQFRDFFLGDMFCSQTYAMGNIELFFCLYARHWDEPPRCNSANSRLFGFFQTWPAILRAFQCIRRFYDSRVAYPHLFNFGKYCFTILSYMSLSLFRINRTYENLSLFIVFSTINSCYCIFWDIVNDWSLGNAWAKHAFLRNVIAYKYWWYYLAMALDVILRFNWIFYVIFKDDIQHSTIVSFCISLSEVIRRGVWVLFRIENEHCTNVVRARASRDLPLPYSPETFDEQHDSDATRGADEEENAAGGITTGALPPQATKQSPSLRRRQGVIADSPVAHVLRRVGSTMVTAHAQDYQRKKVPELAKEVPDSDEDDDERSSDEEEQRTPFVRHAVRQEDRQSQRDNRVDEDVVVGVSDRDEA